MKKFTFSGMVDITVVIRAKSESEARKEIDSFSVDGWILNGDRLCVHDIDLLDESEEKTDGKIM